MQGAAIKVMNHVLEKPQQDLPTWFTTYNGRQTIEAGIKETKRFFTCIV